MLVAHHSLTASIAVYSPASAAPLATPYHPGLCTPALIHACSAESLGQTPSTRGSVNDCAQASAQQGKKLRRLQWELRVESRLR